MLLIIFTIKSTIASCRHLWQIKECAHVLMPMYAGNINKLDITEMYYCLFIIWNGHFCYDVKNYLVDFIKSLPDYFWNMLIICIIIHCRCQCSTISNTKKRYHFNYLQRRVDAVNLFALLDDQLTCTTVPLMVLFSMIEKKELI